MHGTCAPQRLQAHCARAGGSQKKMMGKKALDAARILVEDSGLQGRLTPEEFLREREAKLDLLFPTAELMPGSSELPCLLRADAGPLECPAFIWIWDQTLFIRASNAD